MVAPLAATVAVSAVVALVSTFLKGADNFVPGVCDRLEPYIFSELVGQELAVQQLCDAVCDHLRNETPQKPLVASVHGPPGVGKSLLHHLLARALYNKKPAKPLSCPGTACAGYKVLYGMDYIAGERGQQHALLREALLHHLHLHPEALIVIEEYDKMDCQTRGLLKQLVDAAHTANVTISRSIILLESNTGFPQLHGMLVEAGSRQKIRAEPAQHMLKDLLFSLWAEQRCESEADTVKLLSLVDFYLPFLPLERAHVLELFRMRLAQTVAEVRRSSRDELAWDASVPDFLAARVDFDGPYPIEGAKEVRTLMTRYVTRALRNWAKAVAAEEAARQMAHKSSGSKKRLRPLGPQQIRLRVSRDGSALEIDSLTPISPR